MSTFAVFGMTRDVALTEAKKTVKTTRPDPKNIGQYIELSVDDWLYKVGQRADQIMGGQGETAQPAIRRTTVRPAVH
jgi:hypothetical protein